jgi:hypothetical protein
MDFTNYKFRCSALGNIVSKSGKFTDGNKTYIDEVFAGIVHNCRKEVNSKFFEKGLFEEESGITLLNQTLYKNSLVLKNKERKENDFIHGEADCIKDGIVYDIKNAWDCFTFEKAELTHNYKWQLVGYAWLWGLDKARLFYCLNNTPEHLILDEERMLFYKGNYGTFENQDYVNDCFDLRKKHTHDNKPLQERFKCFDVEVLESDIESLKQSVVKAREYMNELFEIRNNRIKSNIELMTSIK